MKKLTQSDRKVLQNFATSVIRSPDTEAKVNEFYELVVAAIKPEILKVYPLADMRVLEKYDCATRDYCINRKYTYNSGYDFKFRDSDVRAPLVPSNRGCFTLTYEWSKETATLVDLYNLNLTLHEKAIEKIASDYYTLIHASRTFDEVVAIWPAAERLRGQLVGVKANLPALSNEFIDRVRAHNAGGDDAISS